MTVSFTDIWGLKERIQLILQKNTALVAEVKEQRIHVGLPDAAEFKGLTYPCIYISNDKDLLKSQPFAGFSANELVNALNMFKIRIILMGLKKDAKTVEEYLDDVTRLIINAMRGNVTLTNPDSGADALAVDSFPFEMQAYNLGELEGEPLDGRTIKFSIKAID